MADDMLKRWEAEAVAMKRRELTKDEKRSIGDEMLKGDLKPGMDRRRLKNVIRTALRNAERAGKAS